MSLSESDRQLIARARELGPVLRARNGDQDRLAGWLLGELTDLAERLDNNAKQMMQRWEAGQGSQS